MSSNDSNPNSPSYGEPQADDASVTGAVRVNISRHKPEPVEQQPDERSTQTPRIAGNTFRMTLSNGQVENQGVMRAQVSGAADPTGASGVLATARTKLGGPPRELGPNTMVTVPDGNGGGLDVELRVAEQLGFVKREGNTYVEATKEAQAEIAKEPAPQPSGEELFAAEIEADLAQVAGDTNPAVLMKVVDELALQYGKQGFITPNLERVQSLTGFGPERAEVFVTLVEAAYQAQEARVLNEAGIVADEHEAFKTWARETYPGEFKAAAVAHRHARTLNGWRQLAGKFFQQATPTESALNAAGFATKVDPSTKKTLVRVEGVWMPVDAAARLGIF
jgi:hypothetical protein